MSDDVMIGHPNYALREGENSRSQGSTVVLGCAYTVELEEEVIDAIDIAIVELNEGVLPMTLRRSLPDGIFQDIPLIDLLGSDRLVKGLPHTHDQY